MPTKRVDGVSHLSVRPRIVILHPDADVATLLRLVLEERGDIAHCITLSAAQVVATGGRVLATLQPDLCLYGLSPCSTSRWRQLQALTQQLPACRFLVTSTDPVALAALPLLPAVMAVLPEPFDLSDLDAAIATALQTPLRCVATS